MEIERILADFFHPAILFFVLGMIAVLVKSDLEIPPAMSKALAIFLLISVGLEGGMDGVDAVGVEPGLLSAMVVIAIFGIIISSLTAIAAANIFRRIIGLKTADAWATAGLYAGVSTVTFVVAIDMAEAAQEAAPGELIYGGWMVGANIFLDAPGVIAAIILGRLALLRERSDMVGVEVDKGGVFRDAVFGWAIWLMLCGLLVGALAQSFSPARMESAMVFFDDLFHGVLVLFLLDMGITAAKRFGELKEYGTKLVLAIPAAWILPQIWAFTAAIGFYGINLMFPGLLGWGDAFVFAAMAGSASYISAPPAMRAAIPEANPSIYLPMSLALTFPFNILVSLPIWLAMCQALWGV